MNDPISVAYSTWSSLVVANPTWSQRWTSDGGPGYFLIAGHPDFVVSCGVSSIADVADFETNHKANGVSAPSSDDAFALISATPTSSVVTAGSPPGGGVSLYGTDGTVSRAVKVRSNGALRAEVIPYMTQIVSGKIPGHSTISHVVSGPVMGDLEDNNPSMFVIGQWNEQSVAAQWSISSSSAGDTSLGTGAHKVKISYLDSSHLPRTEVCSLNGTTPVNCVSTDMLLIEDMEVIQVGTSGSNNGTLSVHSAQAGGGVVVAQILPGKNLGQWAVVYAHADTTAWISSVLAASSDKNIVFENRHTANFTANGGGLVTSPKHFEISGRGSSNALLPIPRKLLPGEKFEWWAMADSPGDTGYIHVSGWRE